MAALVEGKLVIANNCLRIITSQGISYLPIRPPNVALRTTNPVQVVDSTGHVIAQVDTDVKLGGGEVGSDAEAILSSQLIEPLPVSCPGPYWIVAENNP